MYVIYLVVDLKVWATAALSKYCCYLDEAVHCDCGMVLLVEVDEIVVSLSSPVAAVIPVVWTQGLVWQAYRSVYHQALKIITSVEISLQL